MKIARFLLVFLLSSLSATAVFAQVPVPCIESRNANTDPKVGCAPFTFKFVNCASNVASAGNIFYQTQNTSIDTYEPTQPIFSTPPGNQFIYNTPGVYQLTQCINYTNASGVAQPPICKSITITVLGVYTPKIDMVYCQDNKVVITISQDPASPTPYLGQQFSARFDEPWNSTGESPIFDLNTPYTYTVNYIGAPQTRTVRLFQYCPGGARVQVPNGVQNNVLLNPFDNPSRFELSIASNVATFTASTVDTRWKYLVARRNATGNFIPQTVVIPNSALPNTFTISPVNTIAGLIDTVFQITTVDFCGRPLQGYDPQLMAACDPLVTAQPGQNTLTWKLPTVPNDQNLSTKIFRNTFPLGDPLDNTSPYIDGNVDCSLYNYYIDVTTKQLAANTTPSLVYHSKISAIGNPIPVKGRPPGDVLVSVNDPVVTIKYDVPSAAGASTNLFNRGVADSSAMQPYKSSLENPLVDKNVQVDVTRYCYNIYYIDACEVPSNISKTLCTVLLGIDPTTIPTGVSKQFVWEPYQGFNDGDRIQVFQRINSDGSVLDEEPLASTDASYFETRPFTNTRIARYRIKAKSISSGEVSYSNIYDYIQPKVPIFPDAFSPNGDGLNDVLLPLVAPLKDYNVKIYNRWGNLVFSSTKPDEAWDGTNSGDKCPSGPYIYSFIGYDDTGENRTEKGTIVIVR